MSKLVHNKAYFRKDISYIREMLRQAETAITNNDWFDLEEVFQEIGGVAGNLEMYANDNQHGIKDAAYEMAWL